MKWGCWVLRLQHRTGAREDGATCRGGHQHRGPMADPVHAGMQWPPSTVFEWTVVISSYYKGGQSRKALRMYDKMQRAGVQPNKYTFRSVLKACSNLTDLEVGRRIHADILKCSTAFDVSVSTTLLDMYAKCGSMVEAQHVFDTMSHRDVVSWNALIAGYTHHNQPEMALQIFSRMEREGVKRDARTFVSVLKACSHLAVREEETFEKGRPVKAGSLKQGKRIHAEVVRLGYMSNAFIGSTLLHTYANCGSIELAREVFDGLTKRDVVAWNAMLAGYAQQGEGEEALQLFGEMREQGVVPNDRTFVSVFKACGGVAIKGRSTVMKGPTGKAILQKAKEIHVEAMRRGHQSDVFVGNTLVHMYANFGKLGDARAVFDSLSVRDVVSWNAMIAGYSQQEQGQEALQLYVQMREENVDPDDWTFVSLMAACSSLAAKEGDTLVDGDLLKQDALLKGKQIHEEVVRRGCRSVFFLSSALVHMYATCGSIADSRRVFDTLSQRDVVTWNSMIEAYVRQDQNDEAVSLYTQMKENHVRPDEATFLSVLKACGNAGALQLCSRINCDIVDVGLQQSVTVGNSLVHVYGKCGDTITARQVFDSLLRKNVVTWNALIAGYARQGQYETSLECYEEMQLAGVKPDEVTFLSLLLACNHAGMVDKGLYYFQTMGRDHGISATIEHYVSIVDLLGRAGLFSKIEDLLLQMPMQPDLSLWKSLLGACRKYVNVELGKRAFQGAVSLDSTNCAAYVLMSNIYSHALRWDEAHQVQQLRLSAAGWKRPGQSWIVHEDKVHTFKVGKNSHQQIGEVYKKLKELSALVDALSCSRSVV